MKELRYLEKLENDVNEELYDLLVIHLIDCDKKVENHKDKFIRILEEALKKIEPKVNEFNSRFFYRYMLIYCNKILRFDKKRQDIKDIKKEIIEDFTHSDATDQDKIPLQYQINEIRITYDTSYLRYLANFLYKREFYDKALYCLITARLIEPDDESLDILYDEIKAKISSKPIENTPFTEPKDKTLALDANIVISRIFYDVGQYKIYNKTFDLEKLGNYNKFVITPSVEEEVKDHLKFQLSIIKKKCEKLPFDYNEIKDILTKRCNKVLDKYRFHIESDDISKIKEFYSQYLTQLEEIVMNKIMSGRLSSKLRKLAQRESLLPEEGDMKFLSEAINANVSIYTDDKDFTVFKQPILDTFGVEVYSEM
ncbi:hypothetical protein K9M79_01840 [Candidatus Woesearchaeota archaeon]|nr:hypothetical protein [Candidatus Woesearchaeota archaeon]